LIDELFTYFDSGSPYVFAASCNSVRRVQALTLATTTAPEKHFKLLVRRRLREDVIGVCWCKR